MPPIVEVDGAAAITEGACHVIAEAGANHNNSVDRAIEMAEKAAAAGAWAVKYQLYKAENIAVRNSPKYWTDDFGTDSQFEAFKLSDKLDYESFGAVADACRDLGVAFFATPFDLPAVAALEKMSTPVYKIASGDITYKHLLQEVAATGKPMLLSTGAATPEEVDRAMEWIGYGPDKLVLLVCTLTYPTPDPDGNFARIEEFRRRFDPYLIGFSDHTIGPEGGWMAAALGGVCIEKHYTIDKGLPDVPDHSMSVDPDELRMLVDACNRGALLRGDSWIGLRESEKPARAGARRSVVLERDVAAGTAITAADLACKRPGTGIEPGAFDDVVGRTLSRSLDAGHVLQWDDLTSG